MIFQLLIQPTYTETVIPFKAGNYDIKFLRIDLNIAIGNFGHLYITSRRIPFKDCLFRPNAFGALPVANYNRCGLFIPTRNFNGIQNPNLSLTAGGFQECLDFSNTPLLFKNVFLDGRLDLQFFNAGIGNIGSLDETPPAYLVNSQTHLITLDISPSKKI